MYTLSEIKMNENEREWEKNFEIKLNIPYIK